MSQLLHLCLPSVHHILLSTPPVAFAADLEHPCASELVPLPRLQPYAHGPSLFSQSSHHTLPRPVFSEPEQPLAAAPDSSRAGHSVHRTSLSTAPPAFVPLEKHSTVILPALHPKLQFVPAVPSPGPVLPPNQSFFETQDVQLVGI